MEQLDCALAEAAGPKVFANFDWSVLARVLPSSAGTRFCILNRALKDPEHSGESLDIRVLIAGKTPEEVAGIVRELVIHEVAQILCIGSDRIAPSRSLHDLGMDSLMAVELALGLEQCFGIQLPVMMLNDSPTTEKVTKLIVEKLVGSDDAEERDQSTNVVKAIARQHGEEVTPDEIESLARESGVLTHRDARLTA